MKTLESNAKINLGLSIPFKYENGFHHIVSPICLISFADTLSFKVIQTGFKLKWKNEIIGYFDHSVEEVFTTKIEKNLLYNIYNWLCITTKRFKELNKKMPTWGMSIFIIKRVPSPAGLGGGSSNAATFILFFLEHILQLDIPKLEKKEFKKIILDECIQFGSDIPSLLDLDSVLISGIGEIEKKIKLPYFTGILGLPDFGFSTKKMYHQLNKPIYLKDKNTLQGESEYIRFLKSIIGQYELFFSSLTKLKKLEKQEDFEKSINSLDRVVERTDLGLALKNEFFELSKELFSKEYKFIIQSVSDVRNKIRFVFDQYFSKTEVTLLMNKMFYSLSGSGSAFYVFFMFNSTKESDIVYHDLMKEAIKLLDSKDDKVAYVSFESIKN